MTAAQGGAAGDRTGYPQMSTFEFIANNYICNNYNFFLLQEKTKKQFHPDTKKKVPVELSLPNSTTIADLDRNISTTSLRDLYIPYSKNVFREWDVDLGRETSIAMSSFGNRELQESIFKDSNVDLSRIKQNEPKFNGSNVDLSTIELREKPAPMFKEPDIYSPTKEPRKKPAPMFKEPNIHTHTIEQRQKPAVMLNEQDIYLPTFEPGELNDIIDDIIFKNSKVNLSSTFGLRELYTPIIKESYKYVVENQQLHGSKEVMKDYIQQKLLGNPTSNIDTVRKDFNHQSTTEDVQSTLTVQEPDDEKTKDALMSWKGKAREKRLSSIETSPIIEPKVHVGSNEKTKRRSDIS